jgi:hypothetical protein
MSRTAPNLPLALASLALLVARVTAAVDPGDWKIRQSVSIPAPGVIRLALPVTTLDASHPNLDDLRLIDPAGNEVPFLLERATRPAPPAARRPVSFQPSLTDAATTLLIEAEAGMPLDAIVLSSPAINFVKAARVEVSPDGGNWTVLQEGLPLFRQRGVENLRIELRTRASRYTRVTLDDRRSPPVPFTQATLLPGGVPAPEFPPLAVVGIRRDEFAGESVFTVDVGARNVPLASIEFETTQPLFMRTVTIGVRHLRDDIAVERTLASGSIHRVAVDGLEPRSRLEIPLDVAVPGREMLVHVANGDSPPLAATQLKLRQFPVWLMFHTDVAGNFTLLSGNPRATKPRYDVATLGGLFRATPPTEAGVSAPEANPSYRISTPLDDTALLGAALDSTPWNFRKLVRLTRSGVQELELDLDVLARAQRGFGDLRLLRDGHQVPYLLERPGLTRSSNLAPAVVATPGRPRTTRWEIKLPRAGMPIERLTLVSPTALFQREVHLFETVSSPSAGNVARTLAVASWNHSPGNMPNLVLALSTPPATGSLFLETDNGDNQPIVLGSATAALPVTRVLFKADAVANEPAAPLALYYGHQGVAPPRYDLALVGAEILAAEKSIATLGPEEAAKSGGWTAQALSGVRGGPLLWGALALVVVVLLLVVAKLLPQPPATGR